MVQLRTIKHTYLTLKINRIKAYSKVHQTVSRKVTQMLTKVYSNTTGLTWDTPFIEGNLPICKFCLLAHWQWDLISCLSLRICIASRSSIRTKKYEQRKKLVFHVQRNYSIQPCGCQPEVTSPFIYYQEWRTALETRLSVKYAFADTHPLYGILEEKPTNIL